MHDTVFVYFIAVLRPFFCSAQRLTPEFQGFFQKFQGWFLQRFQEQPGLQETVQLALYRAAPTPLLEKLQLEVADLLKMELDNPCHMPWSRTVAFGCGMDTSGCYHLNRQQMVCYHGLRLFEVISLPTQDPCLVGGNRLHFGCNISNGLGKI